MGWTSRICRRLRTTRWATYREPKQFVIWPKRSGLTQSNCSNSRTKCRPNSPRWPVMLMRDAFSRELEKSPRQKIGTHCLTCWSRDSRPDLLGTKKGEVNELSMVVFHGQVIPALSAPVLLCTDCGSSLPQRA